MFVDVGNIVGFGEKTLLTTMVADDPMYAYFNPIEEDFQLMRKFGSQDILDAHGQAARRSDRKFEDAGLSRGSSVSVTTGLIQ